MLKEIGIKEIRLLGPDDKTHLENIQTNVENDYIPKAFPHLIKAPNALYGLFIDGNLASVAGYIIFAGELAMLGRLRSDVRYQGHGYATEIMAYVRDIALKNPNIRWVGANTQASNKPTHRVLQKIGFKQQLLTYGALSDDVTNLASGAPLWHKVDDLSCKHQWLKQLYPENESFFPYECYYLLPTSEKLFVDETIADWIFYENPEKTRVLIMKYDKKRKRYVHVIYAWDDLMDQPGLWETITHVQQQFIKKFNSDVFIWMDLSGEAVDCLPTNHTFELPSPWTLHGSYRKNF